MKRTWSIMALVLVATFRIDAQWTDDLNCNHYRGAGSSPILFGDLLIMHFDGSDVQFLVALDKKTGKTVWRTDRSVDFQDVGPDGQVQAEGDFRKDSRRPRS